MLRADEDTETGERYARGLTAKLGRYVGRRLDERALEAIDAVVHQHVVELRMRGVGFPPMRAVVFATRGHIDLVRADLEAPGIEQVIRNVVVRFPDISGEEIVPAIRRAFPHYRPQPGLSPVLSR